MFGPGLGDVAAVGDALAGLHEHDAAGTDRAVHALGDADALFTQHRHQLTVARFGIAGIGTDEEAGTVVLDPGRELVEFAIDRIEQHHAADAVGDAADLEAPGG